MADVSEASAADAPSLVERDADGLGIDLPALAPFLHALGPIAVVDLETTGLADDAQAEILEVGAVLVDPGRERVRTLGQLVRPSRPLPRSIVRLTGLADADVAGAPPIESVAPALLAALGGRTLVAHNAAFERSFLGRWVSPDLGRAEYLDTQDLLALTHPDAADLRLESFTRLLLGSEERHRALDDALDAARVLGRVAAGAAREEARYRTARRALERYAPESPWHALLGKGLVVESGEEAPAYIPIAPSEEPPVPFEPDAIAGVLSDRERGARYFPGYRVRAEQIEMARRFAGLLAEGGTLLLEGGTGVGKSLAYLAAAIPFAMENEEAGDAAPLVVSTRTKLLQDQLLRKDIAAAARFLGHPGLRALSIKGRANYVCERRLGHVLAEGRERSIFVEDRLAYAVLMACARTRPHGEVGALPGALVRRYPPLRELLRRAVAARAEQCSREECARHPGCPFGRKRAALARAHLIVANHDLLLRWPPDYPAFPRVVVDEGHELAGVADEAYAVAVRPDEILEWVDDLFGRPSGDGRGALLSRGRRRSLGRDPLAWRRGIHQDLAALGRTLAEEASEYGEVQLPAGAGRALPAAAELAATAADRIEQVAAEAERLDADAADDDAELASSSPVGKIAAELHAAARGLRLAFDASDDVVAGFEGLEPPFDAWRLAIRPVSPASAFREHFLERLDCAAVVSASLFVADDPFASLGELEIEEAGLLPLERVKVESPFPYERNLRVVALKETGDLVEETAAVLALLARELGGRTLGLFTSLRRMHHVAELLSADLRDEGLEILTPRRMSDDPGALVDRFQRSRGGGVLLGARTFWQGVDIPGDDLQAVVIEKLPFEVPTELRRRREARIARAGGDAFARYTVGKMLLSLKQMAGRLIRTEDDRGVVVIVEGRSDRGYFRHLPRALPPGTRVRVARREALPGILAEVGLGSARGGVEAPGPIWV